MFAIIGIIILGFFTIDSATTEATTNAVDLNNSLILAALSGNLIGVQTALKAGANVNAIHNNSQSALMLAVSKNNIDVLNALLAAGANINYQDKNGYTALILSVQRSIIMTKALINVGANVNIQNANGLTALMLAVLVENYNALISANADIYALDLNGYTAISLAKNNSKLIYFQNTDSSKMLLNAARSGDLTGVQNALLNGAYINAQTTDGLGQTALMLAVKNIDIVRVLLNTPGINLNIRDYMGYKALVYADWSRNMKAVSLLISKTN